MVFDENKRHIDLIISNLCTCIFFNAKYSKYKKTEK